MDDWFAQRMNRDNSRGPYCLPDYTNFRGFDMPGAGLTEPTWEVPLRPSLRTPPGLSLVDDDEEDYEDDCEKEVEDKTKVSKSKKRKQRRKLLKEGINRCRADIAASTSPTVEEGCQPRYAGCSLPNEPAQASASSNIQNLHGRVVRLAKHPSSAESVQRALEQATDLQRIELAQELQGHLLDCSRDVHANHIVQKCIVRISESHLRFFVEELSGHIGGLSKHVNGCRVIERWLQSWSQESLKPVHEEVSSMTPLLARNKYGNHILQLVLKTSHAPQQTAILTALRKDLLSLSTDKYGSRVIEEALRMEAPHKQFEQAQQSRGSHVGAPSGRTSRPGKVHGRPSLPPPPSPASTACDAVDVSGLADVLGQSSFCRDGSSSSRGRSSSRSESHHSLSSGGGGNRQEVAQKTQEVVQPDEEMAVDPAAARLANLAPDMVSLIRHLSPLYIPLSQDLAQADEQDESSQPVLCTSMPKKVDACSLAAAIPRNTPRSLVSASASTSGSLVSRDADGGGAQNWSCSNSMADVDSGVASPRSDYNYSSPKPPQQLGRRLQTKDEEEQQQQQQRQQPSHRDIRDGCSHGSCHGPRGLRHCEKEQEVIGAASTTTSTTTAATASVTATATATATAEESEDLAEAQRALFEAFLACPDGGNRAVLATLAEDDIGNFVAQVFLEECRGSVRERALAVLMTGQPSKYLAAPLEKAMAQMMQEQVASKPGRSMRLS